MQKLFDENGVLNIAEIVENNTSYKTIMADGIVTDDELKTQADATVAALRKLQEICTPEQQEAIADAIGEMSVLFTVYHYHQLQELRNK